MSVQMDTINIVFALSIKGNQFKNIDFADTTPEFKNISLKLVDSPSGKYKLSVRKNIFSTDEKYLKQIFKEASAEADSFRYVFSEAAEVKIFDLQCMGYCKDGKLYDYNKIFPDSSRWSIEAVATVTVGDTTIKKIKQNMQNNFDLSALQSFYDAATVIEPIGRFISLYSLLLYTCGDKQHEVDENILKIDPTIAQFKFSLNKAPRYETIFTKLRNELSHRREGAENRQKNNC